MLWCIYQNYAHDVIDKISASSALERYDFVQGMFVLEYLYNYEMLKGNHKISNIKFNKIMFGNDMFQIKCHFMTIFFYRNHNV